MEVQPWLQCRPQDLGDPSTVGCPPRRCRISGRSWPEPVSCDGQVGDMKLAHWLLDLEDPESLMSDTELPFGAYLTLCTFFSFGIRNHETWFLSYRSPQLRDFEHLNNIEH